MIAAGQVTLKTAKDDDAGLYRVRIALQLSAMCWPGVVWSPNVICLTGYMVAARETGNEDDRG